MIDWFTVIAQVVNFLILVLLLRYFLYGRIVAAMDMRQQQIAARWEDAQRQRDEAEEELKAVRAKNRQLDDRREQQLAAVRDEVEQYRRHLTTKVRAEVDALRARWSQAVHEETDSFLYDLRRRVVEGICAIARCALGDLASASLERQIIERFLFKFERLGAAERQAVLASLDEGKRVVVVQTTCELSSDLRQDITTALRARLGDLDIRFEQSADLLCGIALQTDAHKLAWDLRDYLTSMEQELQRSLEEETANGKVRQGESRDKER